MGSWGVFRVGDKGRQNEGEGKKVRMRRKGDKGDLSSS